MWTAWMRLLPDRLTELELLHQPERVLIEWNGMWNQDDLKASEGLDHLPVDHHHRYVYL